MGRRGMGVGMSRLRLRGIGLEHIGAWKNRIFADCGARSRVNDYHGSCKNMSYSALQPGFINRMACVRLVLGTRTGSLQQATATHSSSFT